MTIAYCAGWQKGVVQPIEHSLDDTPGGHEITRIRTNGWTGKCFGIVEEQRLATWPRSYGLKVTGLSLGSHGNVRLPRESEGMALDIDEMTGTQAIFALRSPAGVPPSRSGVFTEFPLDLREWFAPGVLANWVDEVIDLIKAQEPTRTGEVGSMDESGRAMLGLLGLGYVMGVFASSEIARDARMNTPLRLLGGGIFPFPQELRRFRRRHRGLLMGVMFQLFIRAVSEKLGARRAIGGPELHEELLEAASVRLEIATQLDYAD